MKAAVFEEFGGADKMKVSMIDVPVVKEGEVLVHIKAASINPVDNAIREGYLQQNIPHIFPVIPGWDLAGIIEERGYSARRFNVGDGVYGYVRRPAVRYGTFAEYIVLPESYLARKPARLTFEEASGMPLAGLTAWQALFDAGNLQEDQTVLILGASGGVGSLAIQLAKWKKARVVAVASERNHPYMKTLGADYTVDYRENVISDTVKTLFPDGVDLIFDCVGGTTLTESVAVLKSGGTVVSILSHGEELAPYINFKYVFTEPNTMQLEQLRELADTGKLKVMVTKTFTLDQVIDAFKQIQTHHTTGKVVVVP